MKLDLAQYRELAAFAQFGSDLDKVTLQQLNRGQRLTELLKQPQFQPLPPEKQVAILYAGTEGMLDDVEVKDIRAFEDGFYPYLESAAPAVLTDIATGRRRSTTTWKAPPHRSRYRRTIKATFLASLGDIKRRQSRPQPNKPWPTSSISGAVSAA